MQDITLSLIICLHIIGVANDLAFLFKFSIFQITSITVCWNYDKNNPRMCMFQHTGFLLKNCFKKIYNYITNYGKRMEEKKEECENNINYIPILMKTSKWIFLMLLAGGNIRNYNEPVVGRTRLIKEIFLFIKQAKIKEDIYKFRPYKYGPFADEFLFDLKDLKHYGFIIEREGFGGQIIELTPKGIKKAKEHYDKLDDDLKRKLIGVKIRFNTMSLNDLLDYVYTNYPKYAEKSEYNNRNEVV